MKRGDVTLQIIGSSLLYASEEMGIALRNSAYSPNIKERMDHSAAVFDGEGRLLAQAEHIPVHLGSLPWGMKNIIDYCAREGLALEEGTMVVSNDPYLTGTHLNDVTLVAPIYHRGSLVAFAANKAHHADVGGATPGSISMNARTLEDEGFVLEPSVLWKGGTFDEAVVNALASASRTPTERKGDLKAQVAANVTGVRRVRDVIDKYGIDAFELSSVRSFRHSEALTKARLSKFRRGSYEASDFLEGREGEDLTLKARVTVSASGVDVSYAGTSREVDYPLNAVLGVTISGVHFVFRCLLGDDIQANHGAFASLKIDAPSGTILNPTRPHPVGGGNVETSQRNADVIFRAVSRAVRGMVPAAAGGSMNNVMIGGEAGGGAWAFYETIGVGLGGSRSRDGIDGIQANMTNTMNTPIEAIERSFPLRVVRYEFRPDSSGAGTHRGGSGLVRAFEALSDRTTFTVLADRRRHRPWGLGGGGPGAPTRVVVLKSGKATEVPTKSTLALATGDVVEVMTAGGGGYGEPQSRSRKMVARDTANGLLSEAGARRDYRFKLLA
ncbi:MAG: hydantoinase B/oxoprolinase family protein [Nitrososphaerota archaeon]|nr:hydantoinase B/oxoprolinase family protein [Nitrososphaerota archaeon]MDG7024805.1 hydantoinase B/oxoprolinase family protein [Nitrososphaerota archaeon]